MVDRWPMVFSSKLYRSSVKSCRAQCLQQDLRQSQDTHNSGLSIRALYVNVQSDASDEAEAKTVEQTQQITDV
jgi:hypothetical protein